MDNRVFKVIPNDNSIWVMYDDNESDKYFRKYITDKTIVSTYTICSKDKCYIFVNKLDYDNIKDEPNVIKYENTAELKENMLKVLKSLGFPSKIYLNYSDNMDVSVDILGHGAYKYITKLFKEIYNNSEVKPKFRSADKLIYALIDTKTSEEICYMKIAARRALEILEEAFKNIKTGMTEKEIVDLVHKIFMKKPEYFKEYNIVNEEYSWSQDSCPVVLVGPSLLKGGHAVASNEILKKGYTIYFDFGVTIILNDGRRFSSDIQRMGYALQDTENNAPKEVQDVFNTLVNAIETGINNAKPSNKGYMIDEIVRGYILNAGYPNYNHSTGHPVGEKAHNPGTRLSPKSKLSELYLQENGVYTIEPRIAINNGGSIEEMVLVTKNGGITLCDAQKELYIIR